MMFHFETPVLRRLRCSSRLSLGLVPKGTFARPTLVSENRADHRLWPVKEVIVKSSGRFAGLTLLAGLLAATSISMLAKARGYHSQAVDAVKPVVQSEMQSPAALNDRQEAKCIEVAEVRHAHQKAAAYALISHEGPVLDGGDDAGFFTQQQYSKPLTPETPQCSGPDMI